MAGSRASARDTDNDTDGRESRIERFCSNDSSKRPEDWQARRLDRVTERLTLSDAQKAAFKDYQDARLKARADMKAALCTNKPDVASLAGRLAFRQTMMEQRLAGMKITSPKLLAFYNTLDAGQKTKFDEMGERMRERMRERQHRHHHHD